MAILKAFNEKEGFDVQHSGLRNVTASLAIRPGVNRAAIHFSGNAAAESVCNLPQPLREGWIRFFGAPHQNTGGSSNGSYTNNTYVFGIRDVEGNFLFGLYVTANNMWFVTKDTLTTTGPSASAYRAAGNWDFYWRMHPVNGIYRIYYNEVMVFEFIGNTMRSSGADRVGSFYCRPAGGGTSATNTGYDTSSTWSNFIISTTPTFGGIVYTLPVLGSGSIAGWQGDPLSVAGINPNIATGMTATVDNQTHTFNIQELVELAPGVEVNAIILSTYTRYAENSDVTKQAGAIKVGENVYETVWKDVQPLSAGPLQHIFEVNPQGGLDWTVESVNAAEFGVRAKMVL